MHTSIRWDIFCRVVDNFGDAGVCWRLARQLAAEHGLAVTLWIDDLAALARIAHGLDPARDDQACAHVRVRRLAEPFVATDPPADVVIEGFGCGLPPRYVDAMASAARAPVWIVLEYLSAEPWIDAAHGLPSPHPQLGLQRWFWFPGFSPQTGGLLREAGLLDTRDVHRVLRHSAPARVADALQIALFAYPNPALPALLDCWAAGRARVDCVVAAGVASADLARWTGTAAPTPAAITQRGSLTLRIEPMRDQPDYDRLLWDQQLNFVRGEDSFVRAQWAGRPFVWQVYPQEGDTHLVKMDAFLSRYEVGLQVAAQLAQRAFWLAWNTGDAEGIALAWPAYRAALPTLATHADAWAAALAASTDLTSQLVKYCENRL